MNRYYTKKQRRKYMLYWYLDNAIKIAKQMIVLILLFFDIWIIYVCSWALWG